MIAPTAAASAGPEPGNSTEHHADQHGGDREAARTLADDRFGEATRRAATPERSKIIRRG
jgi:hypothetical protein